MITEDPGSEAMRPLEGRVAVVTGGSRGIGRAISERLGRDGAWVVVNYVQDRRAAQAVVQAIRAAGSRAVAIRADVAKKAAVDRMFARVVGRWGRVDIVVNNAGICPFVEFLDIPEDVWDRVQGVNLKGTFLCTQAAARIMVDKGIAGRIISISSVNALVGGPLQAHYTPTKAGQVSLMQSVAVALGRHGITCNSVLPGSIRTDINARLLDDPEIARANREWIPLGRVGTPRTWRAWSRSWPATTRRTSQGPKCSSMALRLRVVSREARESPRVTPQPVRPRQNPAGRGSHEVLR